MEIHQIHTRSQLSIAASWLATGVVAFLCSVLGLLSAHLIEPFAAMFQALAVDLPMPTRFLIATQRWFLPFLFTTLVVFGILKEFVVGELRRRILLTASVFLGTIITVAVVVFILYLPALTLAAKAVKTK